jgi:hypothetical protein
MDPTAAIDPIALVAVLIAYVVAAFLWLTVAIRTNRRG